MQDKIQKFADVILPLAVPQYYTYKIPDNLISEIKIGSRVSIVLGRQRIYTAIVREIHSNPSGDYEIHEILSLLDKNPLLNSTAIKFWEWISDYYMCTTGEVYKAAVPAGLKLESESHVTVKKSTIEGTNLSDSDFNLLRIISNSPSTSVKKLTSESGKNDIMPALKRLIECGLISIEEKLHSNYKPRLHQFIELDLEWKNPDLLNHLLDKLEKKAPRQASVITSYLHLTENSGAPLLKDILLSDSEATASALNALIKKNIFLITYQETSRLSNVESKIKSAKSLNTTQEVAFEKIKNLFSQKDVVLLHGVTSSGKTEIYIQLINDYLRMGKQVLYLLPEIALTTQIIFRLRQVFGDKVGIYHSKFTDSERVEIFLNLSGTTIKDSPDFQIILGVRSSVFLPFKNLGLIIVDEEHENTYKQFDPAPRYNARDAAIILAGLHGGKVLLGSATPSFESYMNAISGRYGLVELNTRYLDLQLPEIKVVNVREERRKKHMKSFFSPFLVDSITQSLAKKEQIILFQNRRGYSPYVECNACGTIPYCKNCDLSLTYHKQSYELRCHYCGYTIKYPSNCDVCGSKDIKTMGFGTEKVEDEIAILFPEAKLARLDLDTTRTKEMYEKIIEDFEMGKVDILIGTQMISKGLDFDRVKVVGILNADNLLNFPDFRSFERSFQLISQVSGRAGRKNERGLVVLQTGNPEHVVVQNVLINNYLGFFKHQMQERKSFNYPPYSRLIKLTLRHKKLPLLIKTADILAEELRKFLGNRVIGPEFPLVNRVFGQNQKCILLKIEKDNHFSERRYLIRETIRNITQSQELKSVQIVADVDPFN